MVVLLQLFRIGSCVHPLSVHTLRRMRCIGQPGLYGPGVAVDVQNAYSAAHSLRHLFRETLQVSTSMLTICYCFCAIKPANSIEAALIRQFLQVTFLFGILVVISSCGGGSSGSTGPVNPPPPPPVADFSLVVESPTVSIQQGGALQFQTVQANPLNGFVGTIQLAVSGLPTGVTGTPSGPYSIQVTNAGPASVAFQLQAALSSPIATTSITVTATSGSISHTITFSVNVTQAAPWTLQVSPASVSVGPGMIATVTVSVTSTSPTPPQLFLALPDTTGITGINFLPPESILTPTQPVQFSINPSAQAQPLQNYPSILTATDNSSGNTASYTLPLTVTVLPYSTNANPTRSTFARTDQAPTGMVYDQQRKLLFVSVEILNEVVVLSTVDGHQVGSITVQYPSGIDESADGTKVYVVSPLVSGITTIDPDLLQVIGKANAPANIAGGTLAPDFFEVATLSNGKVMLQEAGQGAPILLWTPETNDFVQLDPKVFTPAAGLISRTADHSRVLGFAGFGGAIVYDAMSNSYGPLNPGIGGLCAINPTGTQIISVGLQTSPTVIYDANLKPLASMQLDAFPVSGVACSLDGHYAYVFTQQNDFGGDLATVIDTAKFQVVGLVPGFKFGEMLPFSNQSITTFAVDETGMLFGAAFQGVGFLDTTKPTSLAFPLPQWFLATPSLASLDGPTPVQLHGATFTPNLSFSLFAGAPPASPQSLKAANVSASSSTIINATIPAGTVAGSANLTLARSDGFFEVMPDAVTFGPTILRVDANAGSPSGGDAIKIYGYGFDAAGSPSVKIDGKTALITQVHEALQDGLFPTESLDVTTPSGLAGDADVVVSSSSGSAAVTGGFQFLKSIQVYPNAGALDAIVYDQPRQRLYISNQDHSEVEIFDLTSNAFLAPIPVGMQPTNLALTPDGTILAVLDRTDNAVAVVDPVKMQMKTSYSALTPSDSNPGCAGLAIDITAAAPHRMMVDVVCSESEFGGVFHLLNLDTGSLSCVGVTACASNGTDINFGSGIAPPLLNP
jgi:hypothetical protein